MPANKRNGNRKNRENRVPFRTPQLGYYLIVTDTKETEKNYMIGLREAIPTHLRDKLVIKVKSTKTKNLVDEAKSLAALHPQYGEPWIIFDRDQVKDFDQIISKAENECVNVGWSNPCIEIWFSAYFGTMPTYRDSIKCCSEFAKKFTDIIKSDYVKADNNIYNLLCAHGDEECAIGIAERKLKQQCELCEKPSDMCPATTMHILVEEIKSKIKSN